MNRRSIVKGLVSIITPCYNSEKYISNTIQSVINQKYKNWEMIIVDDFSSDKSIEIIKEYIKKDTRISIIELKCNKGAGYARNQAIKKARGQYYAFIDSDDLWYPEKLKIQIEFMNQNNIAFSYSKYNFVSEEGAIKDRNISFNNKINYYDLLKTNHIGCLTAMYDIARIDLSMFQFSQKIVSKNKIFMSEIRCRQDLSLWLSILKNIEFGYGINKVLGSYRVRKKSISSNKIKAIYYQWKLYREVEKLSFSKSIYFLIFYLYFGIIKYFKQLF